MLDRSQARQGHSHAEALRDTVRFASELEALGYHRFWVSEHHSVPGVAGSAPTVLAAAVASATSDIRVGTGGVMLPNHQPLVVAEQFGVLDALFPGRIDMGLGRSVGFTGGIRRALGRDKDAAEDYAGQVAELLGYVQGTQRAHPGVHAIPAEGARVAPFILATGAGAGVAADLGLPLVIAAVRGEDAMLASIERYRARFRPSAWSPHPYVVVSTAVAVAESTERARRLLMPEAWALTQARTRGVFPPQRSPGEVAALPMNDRERGLFEEAMTGQLHGTEPEVERQLSGLVERSGADEILVTMSTFDPAAKLDSYRRLAGIAAPRPA
ncbi:MsnO8 family LLM class oxidoreductase [Amycolatopsis cihanbeyliensis]|uniref:MsnO8 family LLM class oxidoreductase n=1 Tax=Amycolatopsis cihanbeyliensis TaxID=1128664 RepID=UPI001FED13B8|nr:MsnO8 family LLM class oxidoreductase [Amycolatopsis cihanbeyliensis]